MKLDGQEPTIRINFSFVETLTIKLTLHRFLPQLLIQKVYLFRLQNKELSTHIKTDYAFTSTCCGTLFRWRRGYLLCNIGIN